MSYSKTRLVILTITTVLVGGVIGEPATAASVKLVSANPIVAAMNNVRDLLEPLVTSNVDADSAAETDAVDVRRDGKLVIKTVGADIVITLPYASKMKGVRSADGVAFVANEASEILVRPSQGGAQALIVAVNKSAPTEYPFGVENGSVAASSNGGLLLFDNEHRFNRFIPAPWARDAAGQVVATQYVVDAGGNGFRQIVAHRTTEVIYPVVADPSVSFGWINFTLWYSKGEVTSLKNQGYWVILTAVTGVACGKLPNWALQAGCAAAMGVASWGITQTFNDAAARNQCVWISVSYGADLDGWGRYNC